MADNSPLLVRNSNSWNNGDVVTTTKLNYIETDITTLMNYANNHSEYENNTFKLKDNVNIQGNLSVSNENTTVTTNNLIINGSITSDVTITGNLIATSENKTTSIGDLSVSKFTSIPTITSSGVNRAISINQNGQAYVNVPKATSNSLGIITVGNNLTINDGTLNVPQAASNTLGLIKVGNTLSIAADGTLDVPTATTSSLGLIKIGTTLKINSGVVDVASATSSSLGGIKVGDNLSISDGVLSVPFAGSNTAGVVKIGDNITLQSNTISVPIASSSALGLIKVGNGLSIDANGALSATLANATTSTSGLMSSTDKTKLDELITVDTIDIEEQDSGSNIPTCDAIIDYCEKYVQLPSNLNLSNGNYTIRLTVNNGEKTYSWIQEGGE